jgi:hypothetical protein
MKKFCTPKTVFKFQLVFCLLTLSVGLYLSFTNSTIVDNAILGLGILATNYSINHPLNQ